MQDEQTTAQSTAGAARPVGARPTSGSDTPEEPIARFVAVGLRYGDGPEVLRDVSLSLPPGSFHFLVGRSGAGKTSLLRLLHLGMRPSRGRIVLFGVDTGTAPRAALPALRRRIGVVFQDFRLLPELTLFENVALPLRIAGVPEPRIEQDVGRLLVRIRLHTLAGVRPAALSGGQQQLVAIARAVIVRPRLLIADEPTASVDEPLALRLIQLFHDLNRLGTTVLVATHDEALAAGFGHPRLRLEDGRLIDDRETRDDGLGAARAVRAGSS